MSRSDGTYTVTVLGGNGDPTARLTLKRQPWLEVLRLLAAWERTPWPARIEMEPTL